MQLLTLKSIIASSDMDTEIVQKDYRAINTILHFDGYYDFTHDDLVQVVDELAAEIIKQINEMAEANSA